MNARGIGKRLSNCLSRAGSGAGQIRLERTKPIIAEKNAFGSLCACGRGWPRAKRLWRDFGAAFRATFRAAFRATFEPLSSGFRATFRATFEPRFEPLSSHFRATFEPLSSHVSSRFSSGFWAAIRATIQRLFSDYSSGFSCHFLISRSRASRSNVTRAGALPCLVLAAYWTVRCLRLARSCAIA
jgi:hypothetical protein